MITAKINNKYQVIYKSDNLNELFRKIEELAFTFLNTFQVQPEEKYFQKSKSHKWGWVPYGYFAVSRFDKITIYKKENQKGLIYNSDKVDKIISFCLIRPAPREFIEPEKDYEKVNDAVATKLHYWEKLHNNIKSFLKPESVIESEIKNFGKSNLN